MAQPDLDVWMNGELVGTWFRSRTGVAGFRYTDEWLRSVHVRPLSLSLPIPAGGPELKGSVVEHWFDNLLPDSQRIRDRLRHRFHAGSASPAHLLAAIGRDCVGAVQLLPSGSAAPRVDLVESEPLDDRKIARILRNVTSDAPDEDMGEDFRISIAGAQEKTALLRIGRRWHRPLGATPTTHIFKLPLGLVGNMRADMTTSVENEWLCAKLLAALGFSVAPSEIAIFQDQKVLVVERFDRRWMDGRRWIARLPQEDFCQALGVPSELKYESDRGPGIAAGLRLLSGGEAPQDDKLQFVLAQLAFWLMAATDGHAKNFSIFIGPRGIYRMTPAYDVLSAWPIIGTGRNQLSPRRARLAMALRTSNAHYHLHEISTRHWQALAGQSGVPGAFDKMVELVRSVPAALDAVDGALPETFPIMKVWRPVRAGMLAHAAKFNKALPP